MESPLPDAELAEWRSLAILMAMERNPDMSAQQATNYAEEQGWFKPGFCAAAKRQYESIAQLMSEGKSVEEISEALF